MAGTKEIKKRINSVKNTRKITRTMEMVSTAKSKKLIDRVHAAQPYAQKLHEVMVSLSRAGGNVDSVYLQEVENPARVALLVVTANRGLCGGYNSNTLRMARARLQVLQSQGKAVDLFVVGKKGKSYFNFIGYEMKNTWLDIDDNFTYEQAEEICLFFMNQFIGGVYDTIEVASVVYYSAGSQKPDITILLPMGMDKAEAGDDETLLQGLVDYDPEPDLLMEKMLPLAIKTHFYKILLEAVASEQIFRRIAMKNATDAAGEMLKLLTRTYNRARQASITQELAEIVAGADAL
ncbi:MAG: ATP synthase F1 subunit gamma [Leptospiraceae bacterium]|nr:ATP synthase F1 subunit gamma [Leptospiraceae bacterium]